MTVIKPEEWTVEEFKVSKKELKKISITTRLDLFKSLFLKKIPYFWWEIEVGDNLVESNNILVMLPWITPNGPYAYWDIYNDNWKIKGLETYGGKSPFTETLEEFAGEKEAKWKVRTLQFNYPDKAKKFDIETYLDSIEKYIEKNCGWINWKKITVYWQSMGWKVAIHLAWKLLDKWAKVENIVIYAPALEASILVPPANLIEKIPLDIATFFQKFIAGPTMKRQISNAKDWWLEITPKDLENLAKAVAWYDVRWKQMKERLKFIREKVTATIVWWKLIPNTNFLERSLNISINWSNIIVLSSDIGNWSDGVIVNKKMKELIKDLFLTNNIKFIEIEWIPHVSVPQAANTHGEILKKNL